ncbi:NAD(P)H-hydrate dehydratase [Thaumasiovibrio sp. DFM-14]|uniref:NAD(P)H-hydrate dehydratase n=1 Tax=Thaumasiovibrio sp. DFM-14 TaxID=3384792 RepID=UPI0039A0F667
MVSLSLPHSLYRAEQVRQGERRVAKQLDIDLYTLMERAGQALFALFRLRFPDASCVLVCCGSGNNGGDGYIFARLAKQAGLNVVVWQLGGLEQLQGDAKRACHYWREDGGEVRDPLAEIPENVDCIVDALLGTGMQGEVRTPAQCIINAINHSAAQVLSVDLPSGLCADSGKVLGCAVRADLTLTFVAVKRGLMTGQAADYTGEMHFAGLGIEAEFATGIVPDCLRVMPMDVEPYLLPRKRTAHKGQHGRLLCLGGDFGMGGAIRLASEAALRTGAGLVAVLTRSEHLNALLSARPELMASGWDGDELALNERLQWADVVLAGPGMGQARWGVSLLSNAQKANKNIILDADGLNLLSHSPDYNPNRILTPHPGEAARLLNCSVQTIESDRFQAVVNLQNTYGGVVILKGAGSLVYDGTKCWVISAGNPGMATGGMGDVLSGILAALVAQGLTLSQAAVTGTWLHSCAADLCSQAGERGMLASDLFPYIRQLVNPDKHDADSN